MTTTFRSRTCGAVLSVAVCTVALAACGGGSSSGGTSNASATTANGAAAGGPGGGRFAALRTCLAQNGINLPARPARPAGTPRPTPGTGGGGGGGFGLGLGGGGGGGAGGGLARRLPAGVTQAQFQAALKKCGGGAAGAGGPGLGARRLQTPAAKAALAKFVTCMQGKGVKLPAANTTGTGPVFNTKGINTTTAQFKAAYTACQPLLASVFPRRAAGTRAGGTTTTTPSPQAPTAQ